MDIRLTTASPADLDADLLVLGLTDLDGLSVFGDTLAASLRTHLERRGFKATAGATELIPTLGALSAATLVIVGLGEGSDADLFRAAGAIGYLARDQKAASLGLHFGSLSAAQVSEVAQHLAIGNYRWDRYLPEDRTTAALATVQIMGAEALDADAAQAAIQRGTVLATWQAVARDLVNRPAADLDPAALAAAAQELAKLPGVTVETWDWQTCLDKKLVGIEAVGQGSSKPGNLSWIRYQPENAVDHIAFVGKGVTFDAGGLSLKPSAAMQTMRCDMGGAATALAATGAIAELGLPVAVDCLLPAVENMCAANSFKLGDMITYNNGVTVEIHNTDAEGRLILADALILASGIEGVSRVVDMATLTGACIVALGTDYTALFTEDDALAGELLEASDAAGELMWRLPLHKPYNRMLKGTWSKIKNVGGREAGSITAALFLQHFVAKGVTWAHLDIAGTAFADKPEGAFTAGGTGQVVRALAKWAEELGEA